MKRRLVRFSIVTTALFLAFGSLVEAATYAITPNPATVSEGAGTFLFTITRSGTTPAETIYASTMQTEGSANSGDYTGIPSQPVTFTAGQVSRTVTVTILNDTTVESSETFGFIVQRNASDPATTYLAKSTFTITDNDAAATTYAITPNPTTVSEGVGTFLFTITRSGGTPAETIYASTMQTEGSANSGDYTGIPSQPVTFTAGQASRTMTVTILNDTTVESSETFGFIVQRNASDPATTYLAKSTFTITDNDTAATTYAITPNPTTVSEGVGTFLFTITRSGGTPAETIYVSTTTTEGSANSGDYTGIPSQPVTFTAGQASRTVTVTILNDTTVESSETFGFIVQRNASDPVTTYLAKSTFTITDNDTAATTYAITPNPTTVSEGVGTFLFTITRSGTTPAETIYASTMQTEGSANNGDYTGIPSQPVTFTAGQASRTMTVTILNDTTVESSEIFGFIVQRNASDPATTYLAKSTFTITDNDAATTYAITPNPTTVSEGVGTFLFTITRSGTTPAETIYASTMQTEGSANNGDYTGIPSQPVTFTAGQASRTVTVTILNDTTVESSEIFGFIVQRNASDPATTYLAKSTFTITDNDVADMPAPTISSVNGGVFVPASSANQSITINGANFQNGCTLTFTDTSGGIYASVASKLTFNSSGQLTYLFNNANDSGTWKIKVNNPDGKSSTLFNFTVQVASRPNLIVENVAFSPANVNSGSSFLLGFRIRNIGPGNAIATAARLRLTTDTTLTMNDPPLSPLTVSVPAISSGSSYSFSSAITTPESTPQGLYYVGVFADCDNRANQSDTTDDTGLSTARITVNSSGGVAPTVSITPANQTAVSGFPVVFKAVVQGQGPFLYQWMRNTNAITEWLWGSEGASIVVSAKESGDYSVRVNSFGTIVTSIEAHLTITALPTPPDTLPGVCVLIPQGTIDANRPTFVITHGWGGWDSVNLPPTGKPPLWVYEMGEAISNRLDRDINPLPRVNGQRANVFYFYWSASYNGLVPAAGYADDAGTYLAKLLTVALSQNYTNTIHFIGHSLGTIVNAHAVTFLPARYKGIQFTILDAPLDVSALTSWPESCFGAALLPSKVDWVDNYYGHNGFAEGDCRAFGGKVTGAAENGGWGLLGTGHAGVHEYYYKTITNVDWTVAGFDYSKIRGENGSYNDRPNPNWDTAANRLAKLSEVVAKVDYGALQETGFRIVAGTVAESTPNVNGQLQNGIVLSKAGTPLRMSTLAQPSAAANLATSTSIVETDVSIPAGARTLQFEFNFSAAGTGDWMTVQFNDTQLFNFRGESFVGTNFHTGILPIGEYAGQTGVLTFKLNSGSSSSAQVILSDFKIMGTDSRRRVAMPWLYLLLGQ